MIRRRLSKHILVDGFNLVMDIERSHGPWLVDKKTGEEYLDMFSMFASGSVGYNHPYILSKQDFLGKMAVNKPTLSDVYNTDYVDFLEIFSRVAIPDYLPYAFFISGGTLAVENTLKAAFDWKTRKNITKKKRIQADKALHFRQAFHGRSGYTLAMTNTADIRKTQYFPNFDWPRVINPKLHFPITKNSLEQTIKMEKRAIKQILLDIHLYKDRIACIIIEPIQGEGGDNHFRKEFFEQLREICDQFELLLIFDEVQTGMGITGKMWAHEYFVKPDIISFGKKSQVCGMLASKTKLDEVKNNVFQESSRINSTFGGNFIDMLRCKFILEIYEKENLVTNAASMGKYLLNNLLHFQSDYPDIVSNARGLGLFCAFDMPDDEMRDHFISNAFKHKMLILRCGDKSIRFRPHLNTTKKEIDHAMFIAKKTMEDILKKSP